MPTHFTPSLVPRILLAYVGQQRLRRLDVQVRASLASIAADILTRAVKGVAFYLPPIILGVGRGEGSTLAIPARSASSLLG